MNPGKYNDYLTVNGGNVGRDAFNKATKPANVHYISKDTPLIKLLSLADTDQNDWLYIVLMDIVSILVTIVLCTKVLLF